MPRSLKLVIAVIGCLALVSGWTMPVEAQTGLCQFCAETADGDEECADAVTWIQYDMGYEDCEVKEKCFLGVICWTVCRGTRSCLRGVVTTDGPENGCSTFELPGAEPAQSPGGEPTAGRHATT